MTGMPTSGMNVLALAGGVGGAKLADGLAHLLGERLTVAGNTGDDFEHLGFSISPDLDTVMYTLAGIANPELGWGIAGETWSFMEQVERLGGPVWFRLGDRDIATHALRTSRLRSGESLTAVTADLCRALGISARVVPMTDDRVRTMLETEDGPLAFQDYFVRLKCAVAVRSILFEGAEQANPNPALMAMRGEAAPQAIVICPSNPYLSIDPILAVPGLRDFIRETPAPVVAVSPIVAGAAIKGPAAKLMAELGHTVSAATVAEHYRGLVDALLIDEADAPLAEDIERMGMKPVVASTVMRSRADRITLAGLCLKVAQDLA
ncbi:2-phospho-L-lactate transferase [Aquabacter sp. CN5-332]|uniref:2-phospho-L-lactate transferase n=1 Tax=Aquabacter sp. CN5-332 TaxID=3156608 RepID=UPI0032B56EC8